jgi:hypothetical protein
MVPEKEGSGWLAWSRGVLGAGCDKCAQQPAAACVMCVLRQDGMCLLHQGGAVLP